MYVASYDNMCRIICEDQHSENEKSWFIDDYSGEEALGKVVFQGFVRTQVMAGSIIVFFSVGIDGSVLDSEFRFIYRHTEHLCTLEYDSGIPTGGVFRLHMTRIASKFCINGQGEFINCNRGANPSCSGRAESVTISTWECREPADKIFIALKAG